MSGVITDEEMQELQNGWMRFRRTGPCLTGFCKGKDILYKYRMYKKLTIKQLYERCENEPNKEKEYRSVVEICGDVITFGTIFRAIKNNER